MLKAKELDFQAHGQTDSSTIHRPIPFVKNLETSQETSTPLECVKPATLKAAVKSDTSFC